MSSHFKYRPCAGIMLVNQSNLVFVGQRIDTKQDAWQMPQGGIDEGELPDQAAFRELEEEIGTAKAEIITSLPNSIFYDLPSELTKKLWNGKYKGQEQFWFLMRFTGCDKDINLDTLHPEFSSFKWIDPKKLPDCAIYFKKDVYEKVIDGFLPYI